MKLPEDQLLAIVQNLTKYHGPDIAHDVVVKLLIRRNPPKKLKAWATVCAVRQERRERRYWKQPKLINLSDAGADLTRQLNKLGLI